MAEPRYEFSFGAPRYRMRFYDKQVFVAAAAVETWSDSDVTWSDSAYTWNGATV